MEFLLPHLGQMTDKDLRKKLLSLYRSLFAAYGPQHWWPGETAFEVMVGAVLTQNTAWTNVEKAIANLKREGLLSPRRLAKVPLRRLASLLRPSGYFNIKARRLRNLTAFLANHYQGSIAKMFRLDTGVLREELLSVNGIGPETADAILLYAGDRPVFVVDAYTRRVLARHGLATDDAGYDEVQRLFMQNLSPDTALFNEYHALIVRVAKERCRKREPLCAGCSLEPFLP